MIKALLVLVFASALASGIASSHDQPPLLIDASTKGSPGPLNAGG